METKYQLWIMLVLAIVLMLLASCKTNEVVVERMSRDTLYRSDVLYDSIYISNDHYVDRCSDTVFIRDHQMEYRYRYLHDTLYIHRVDTIPKVITVKESFGFSLSKVKLWMALIPLILSILFIIRVRL